MSAYQTVVVGTDGSDSSLRAVDRAAAIAADHGAKLIVVTAHLPVPRNAAATPSRRGATTARTIGRLGSPFLRDPAERQGTGAPGGAKDVEERSIVGAPVSVLVQLAQEVHADLMVVGNVGLSSVAGRLLGSVPSEVSRRVKVDVLIVHTAT